MDRECGSELCGGHWHIGGARGHHPERREREEGILERGRDYGGFLQQRAGAFGVAQ